MLWSKGVLSPVASEAVVGVCHTEKAHIAACGGTQMACTRSLPGEGNDCTCAVAAEMNSNYIFVRSEISRSAFEDFTLLPQSRYMQERL